MNQPKSSSASSSSLIKNLSESGEAGGGGPVAMSVPANLKTLIRMIMRAFYGFELYLIMEMLMQYSCIKEEDLAELLRLDLKNVHQQLVNLKKEKFISERCIMETTADNRQSKHSYFYINYKMTVNVIKYKLDKIRIQIESEEKQCTSRANFKCTNCSKTYSDLDTKDIFLTMRCLYCNHEVEEDASTMPNRATRNLLARFNTQMEIVFELLSRVEHIRLADDILRPEPADLTHILEKLNGGAQTNLNAAIGKNGAQSNGKSAMVKFDSMGNMKWSGDKTRNQDLLGQTKISINFDSSVSSGAGVRKPRELPSIILQHQTKDEDFDVSRDSALLNSVKLAANETINHSIQSKSELTLPNAANLEAVSATQVKSLTSNASLNVTAANLDVIIMQKLLIHEKKTETTSTNNPLSPSLTTTTITNTTTTKTIETSNLLVNGTKKRDLNGSQEDDIFYAKKRKLNNGEIVGEEKSGYKLNTGGHYGLYHQKSYSDGASDREVDSLDEEYFDDSNLDEEQFVPRVSVQNKLYRLDKLNYYLISKMSDQEKNHYIDVCRQLYTTIYEL